MKIAHYEVMLSKHIYQRIFLLVTKYVYTEVKLLLLNIFLFVTEYFYAVLCCTAFD